MTPFLASSPRTTYRAIASATMRAFANVKSSAIMPRHPSVPNVIGVISRSIREGRKQKRAALARPTLQIFRPLQPQLQKLLNLLFFQPFHNFTYLLRSLSRANQQRFRCLPDHQIIHPDARHKSTWTVDIVAVRLNIMARPGP